MGLRPARRRPPNELQHSFNMSWSDRISEWLERKKTKNWTAHLEPYRPESNDELPFAHVSCGVGDCIELYVASRSM
jgi:hypothetical protein